MAGEIEAKLKAERMFAEAKAKAIGGPYANISKEYVDKYMDSSSLSKALADRVSTNYSIGYLSGWAGIPGDMLNALTSWAVSGIPDQRLRQQAKTSLTVAGTEDIGEAMGADVESEAFQWGTVGLPGLEDLVKKSPYLSMVLFHGTPHKFKKFDISKIGTGEGAQAFGHGLYFAENPKVAGEYQKVLSGTNQPDVSIGGIQIQSHKGLDWDAQDKALADINNSLGPVAREVAEYVQNEGYSFTLSNLEDALTRTDGYYNLDAGQVADAVDLLKGADVKKIPAGHLYEVDIDDEVIEKFLDWDAPLSEQPEVMKRLKLEEQSGLIPRNTITPDMSGEQAYNALARGQTTYGTGSKEEASKFLADRGIPGIRFYDGNSRLSGRPFKQVKREFLKELPEDAEFDDLLELVGTGHFTKEQDNVIRELQKNDWLGFDYPSQAINAAYADNVRNWDPTDSLLQALDESAGGANRTRNIVVFDPETSIKTVKRDGELVYEATTN